MRVLLDTDLYKVTIAGDVNTRLAKLQGMGTFRDSLSSIKELVAHGGFEPPISALRGRCRRPLDECAT